MQVLWLPRITEQISRYRSVSRVSKVEVPPTAFSLKMERQKINIHVNWLKSYTCRISCNNAIYTHHIYSTSLQISTLPSEKIPWLKFRLFCIRSLL